MLGELITSKTRLRLLIKFFVSQANKGHLNGLANEMGESTNGIRKELNHLEHAGYLKKLKVNNKVEYKANTDHPLFDTLKKVVYKHLGLEDLVSTVIERMGNVKKIILISSVKNRKELPKRLKVIQKTWVYKLFPTTYINSVEDFSKYAFGDFAKKRVKLYKEYLSVRNSHYLNWAIYNVLNWQQKKTLKNIIHN